MATLRVSQNGGSAKKRTKFNEKEEHQDADDEASEEVSESARTKSSDGDSESEDFEAWEQNIRAARRYVEETLAILAKGNDTVVNRAHSAACSALNELRLLEEWMFSQREPDDEGVRQGKSL